MQLRNKFGNRLSLAGVTSASSSDASSFAQRHGVNYPILAEASETQKAFGVRALPATYLIDPEGMVVSQDLEAIEELVAQKLGG